MTKHLIILLLVFICLFTASCKGTVGDVTRYDIPSAPSNLDPQLAFDQPSRLIIGNIYEGLLVQDAKGNILPGVADLPAISSDKLVYTFTLRQEARWQDGSAITSDDFLFTFERLFNSDSPSQYAASFSHIRLASKVLSKEATFEQMGITTPNERTIIFELERPDPFFLELLAQTAAVPCNRDFFSKARGRYGLELKYILSNGPFYIEKLDTTKNILLRVNEHYSSSEPVLSSGVNLYIAREDPLKQFLNGKTDLLIVSPQQLAEINLNNIQIQSYQQTTWCIVFNQNGTVFGNPLLRQSLAQTIDRKAIEELLPSHLTSATTFIPPEMHLLEKPFRSVAASPASLAFDPERGKYLFDQALQWAERENLPPISFIIPVEEEHSVYMGMAKQDWQKYLGAFINLEQLSLEQISKQLASGDYQMLFYPFSPSDSQISSFLGNFSTASDKNYYGYHNPLYDIALNTALQADSITLAAQNYSLAENIILSDAVVIPIYNQATSYCLSNRITGIEIIPFGNVIKFKSAVQNN